MAPKPKAAKKEEELESLEGLPKAFPFIAHLWYNVNDPENKKSLKEQLEGELPPKSKLVTREDIVECGKRKELIAEEDDLENLPPDKIAKSAAAKMYELLAGAMKEKGVRYKEIKDKAITDYLAAQKPKEEEAKGKGGKAQPAKPGGKKEEVPQIDVPVQYPDDEIDLYVFFADFPRNESEAIAFAQEKYALNAFVCIKEGKAPEKPPHEEKEAKEGEDKKEEKEEKKEEEVKKEVKEVKKEVKKEAKKEAKKEVKKEVKKEEEKKEAEPLVHLEPGEEEKKQKEEEKKKLVEYNKKSQEYLEMLEKLSNRSERESPLRQMLRIDIEYIKDQTDVKAGIVAFQTKLMETLNQIGVLYIAYRKYMSAVKLKPLCKVPAEIPPIRPVEDKLEVKKEEKKEEKKEDKKEEKKEGKKEDKKEEKKEVLEEKKAKTYDTDAVLPFKNPEHPYSLDDVPSVWHLFFYQKNIEKLNQEAKKVGAILVCLMQQICSSNQEQPPVKPTETQELMQLFQRKREQLLSEQKIVEEMKEKIVNEKEANLEVGENVKSPYHSIYDDHDFVRSQYHGERLFNEGVSLSDNEIALLANMMYPGKARHMMPSIPLKPESVRGSLRSEMHPFSSLPIYEFERALVLTEFEKMFAKTNPQGIWNFGNRVYEEHFTSEALSEVFSNCLTFNPDILTSYYLLKDALLVGLYYQSPPGRILHKQWNSKFQHLPDFPNYFKFFAGGKQTLQELLDLDDNKVGSVEERDKFMYPSDNSVIKVAKKKVGGEEFPSVQVMKDSYYFGIKSSLLNRVGDECDFWLRFENGSRLKVNMQAQKGAEDVKDKRGAVATVTFACGLITKFTGTGDVVQIRTENICKDKSQAEEMVGGFSHREKKELKPTELHRVITGKGTVMRYMDNGSIEVMMANGNTSEYKDGLWVGINSKGKRRGRKANEFEMDPIHCVVKTDPETLARVTLRDDGVICVKYKDGKLFTKHKDGTTMLTSPNGQSVFVEKEGFAPVKVRIDPVKVRSNSVISRGGTDALLGVDDIMVRSNDGRVAETYLPDGTFVQTFKEKQQLDGVDNFSVNAIHLIRRSDGGVIKVKEDGEVVVMTPEQRVEFNEKGQKKELGLDVDYFYELFAIPNERKSGVYTVKCNLGKMFTKDEEGNKFYLYSNGVTRERIAVSFNLDNVQEEEPEQPPEPMFTGPTYIDEQAKFLPAPKTIMDPRLFLIRNDGTGCELLSEKQLANYFRCKQREVEAATAPATAKHKLAAFTKKFDMEKLEGMENSKVVSYLTKLVRERDVLSHLSFIEGIEMPRIIDHLQQSIVIQKEPPLQVYSYRCILIHPQFDEKKREVFNKDIEKYQQWKEKVEQTRRAFGTNDKRTPEELEEEKKIQLMILNQRKGKDKALNQEEIKGKAVKEGLDSFESQDEEKEEKEQQEEVVDAAIDEQKQGNSKGSQKLPIKKEKVTKQKPAAGVAPSALGAQKSREGAIASTLKSRGSEAMTETISQMSCTAEFVANYFFTKKGMEVKYEPISEEKLKELNEKRLKRAHEKMKAEPAQEAKKEEETAEDQAKAAEKHNPIIALEPEETAQKNLQSKMMKSIRSTTIKESNYKTTMSRMKEVEQKEKEASENYHVTKTKDFTVLGATRMKKEIPDVLNRPKPVAEINEQHISIDAITDRRIKTSSMANRGYFNAPPVQTIRKQGQHQMIAKALNKKQTFEELMAETNSMINYALNDPNKRNFVMNPEAKFGKLKIGGVYETNVSCKNEDVMPQRFTVRQPKCSYIRVFNLTPGPVAQGMNAMLKVEIRCGDKEASGLIQDEFQLITKTEIFKVPVTAQVLPAEEFDALQAEEFKVFNKPLLLVTVREKGKDEKKAIMMEGSLEPVGVSEANETSLSGVKLPRIDQGDDTRVELDPTKKIEDIVKKDKTQKEPDSHH